MNWMIVTQAFVAAYLITGALIIDADSNLQSKFYFKVIPFFMGLALAFGVLIQLRVV